MPSSDPVRSVRAASGPWLALPQAPTAAERAVRRAYVRRERARRTAHRRAALARLVGAVPHPRSR